MKNYNYIEKCIRESCGIKNSLVGRINDIEGIAYQIAQCYLRDNKVLIMGNGGSAADAQHIAGELVGRFKKERKALSAIALTTDTSILTALSNDYNFEDVFSRQVEAHAKPHDILIGISTSGTSKNVVRAFQIGKYHIGTFNISLTGEGGGKLKNLSDICLDVNSKDTPRIQEAHELIYHIVCDLVEQKLFGDDKK